MLERARARAREVSQKGALFPWRTINGRRPRPITPPAPRSTTSTPTSLMRSASTWRSRATMIPYQDGAEMLVETARLWYDLGFFSERQRRAVLHPRRHRSRRVHDGGQQQHLHEPHGPGEPAVRGRRGRAAAGTTHPEPIETLVDRTGLAARRAEEWRHAADADVHGLRRSAAASTRRTTNFLDRKVWDFGTRLPRQVPAAAALSSRWSSTGIRSSSRPTSSSPCSCSATSSPPEQKRRNFDYYDPLTTGDSSLSACIQSIVAAELGYRRRPSSTGNTPC